MYTVTCTYSAALQTQPALRTVITDSNVTLQCRVVQMDVSHPYLRVVIETLKVHYD
jgi:hypothetical protein